MPTTRHTLVKARLASTRRCLDQILDRLTPDLMEWSPGQGTRTFAGQLAEIVEVEVPLITALTEGNVISDAAVAEVVGDDRSLEGLRACLNSVRQQTLAYLDSLTESELIQEGSYGGAWFGSLWLPTLPRAEVFLNIAEHELYHVGQLTSYLWMRGDNPYQW